MPDKNQTTTRQQADIAYGITTAIAAFVWPPAAIALGGAWLADRKNYPDAKD